MHGRAGYPQPPVLTVGTLLQGRYLIQGYLGGGGFAHIYLARDTALGHRRAIKEAFARDGATQQQFRLEAEFLLNARHPNLVRGYAVFEQHGRLYLVMDYVEGETLEDIAIEYIRRTGQALGEAEVLDWMLPICSAVQSLHSQPVPIIHRDVKPANIKLSVQSGVPVLIDLGLAKLYARGSRTIGAALAFTPGYAPPEQYQATGATDQRTDVYGLGATLYFLLTGYQPVEAPARLSTAALRPPRALNPALSPAVEATVLRALALDPAQRQQEVRGLVEELQAARAQLVPAPSASRPHASVPPAQIAGPEALTASAIRCSRCGAGAPSGARYCMACAAPLTPRQVGGAHRLVWQTGERPAARMAVPARAPHHVAERPAPGAGRGLLAPQVAGAAAQGMPQWSNPHAVLAKSPIQSEAWTSFAALLAVVCLSLSLTAPFATGMVVFAAPALGLGHWSLAQGDAPSEFRWLARVAVAAGWLWAALYVFAVLRGGR